MTIDEPLIVRVTATFLDFSPLDHEEQKTRIRKTRSSSLPPTRTATQSGAEIVGKDEYLSSLFERAQSLRFQEPLIPDHEEPVVRQQEQDEQRPPAPQGRNSVNHVQFVGNDDGTACACGAPFTGNSRFCYQCGNGTTCACGAPFLNCGRFCYECGGDKKAGQAQSNSRITTMSSDGLPLQSAGSVDTFDSPRSSVTVDSQCLQGVGLETCKVARQHESEGNIGANAITTLMICNIPCRQTVKQVVDVINDFGFSGTYDFVYMPPRKSNGSPTLMSQPQYLRNLGYGFVNFRSSEHASAFMKRFHNYSFLGSTSSKKSYAKPALCQGYEANLEMRSNHLPSGCLAVF